MRKEEEDYYFPIVHHQPTEEDEFSTHSWEDAEMLTSNSGDELAEVTLLLFPIQATSRVLW